LAPYAKLEISLACHKLSNDEDPRHYPLGPPPKAKNVAGLKWGHHMVGYASCWHTCLTVDYYTTTTCV